MLYTLYGAIRILLFFVEALFIYGYRFRIKKLPRIEVIAHLCHLFSRVVMKLTRSELVVEGKEFLKLLPSGRRIVVISNHESYIDIPCVLGALDFPVGFIAKKELNRIPLLGIWIRMLGGVMLDRENLRASYQTLTSAFDNEETRALLVFPEGTRNKESRVGPFKPGSLRLAFDNDAVLLPVTLCGGRRKFEGNGYRIKPGRIYCRIHPMQDTRRIGGLVKAEYAAQLREQVSQVYDELDKKLKEEVA